LNSGDESHYCKHFPLIIVILIKFIAKQYINPMKQHIGPFPYLFVLFLLLYNACFSSTPTAFVADDSIYHDIFRPSRPLAPAPTTRFDSLTIEQKKNFLRAGIEWFSIQAIPASVNYFIRKDP